VARTAALGANDTVHSELVPDYVDRLKKISLRTLDFLRRCDLPHFATADSKADQAAARQAAELCIVLGGNGCSVGEGELVADNRDSATVVRTSLCGFCKRKTRCDLG
jgi:hypothetical protein